MISFLPNELAPVAAAARQAFAADLSLTSNGETSGRTVSAATRPAAALPQLLARFLENVIPPPSSEVLRN